jgi:hypothetical protein
MGGGSGAEPNNPAAGNKAAGRFGLFLLICEKDRIT